MRKTKLNRDTLTEHMLYATMATNLIGLAYHYVRTHLTEQEQAELLSAMSVLDRLPRRMRRIRTSLGSK